MIKIIHEREIVEAYKLASVFAYWRDVYSRSIQNYYVLFCEGDLELKQHLILDDKEGWGTESGQWLKTMFDLEPLGGKKNYGIAALIVMGNLTVNGSVINANSDYGNGLYVQGNLTAHNLIAGGSSILIAGNADIEQCTYAHYNDGILIIDGTLNCPIQIGMDHHFEAGAGTFQFSYDSNDNGDFDPEFEFGDEDMYPGNSDLIPKSLRPLLHKKIKTWDEIFETLIAGEYISASNQHQLNTHPYEYYQSLVDEVIAKGGDSKPDKDLLKRVPEQFRTLALCRQVISFHPSNLKYVPKALIDSDLCLFALSQTGNIYSEHGGYPDTLSHVPTNLLTDALCRLHVKTCPNTPLCKLPDKIKTRDFCLYAAQQGCLALEDLPKTLETDETLILEIVKNGYKEYQNLPMELAVQTKFQIAGIMGGGSNAVIDGLEYLKTLDTLPQLLNAAITERMTVADTIPAHVFTTELLEHARHLYGKLPEWQDIENKHSQEFWRYVYKPAIVAEIENDIKSEKRYYRALRGIWRCFWTEEFLIRYVEYTNPHADIEDVPKEVFTPALIAACLRYDKYGDNRDYLIKIGF